MSDESYHKDRLGNRRLNPETLMLGYGFDPALSEGAVKPPVFLTSTFVFRSAEHGKEFFDYVAGRREPPAGTPAGLVYSRFNHPNSEIVEDRLAVYEEAEAGAISVVDGKGELAGLVSDYDVRRALEKTDAISEMSIRDIMNPTPLSITEDQLAADALAIMRSRPKPSAVLPVLNRKRKVVGMVHLMDLVSAGL